jgi:hypothetical protein
MNKKIRIITAVLLVCFAVSGYQRLNHTIYAKTMMPLLIISTLGLQVIFFLTLVRMVNIRRQR